MDAELVKAAGAGVTDLQDVSVDTNIPPTQTLADFESAFPSKPSRGEDTRDDVPPAPKERHRARSQQATPDDVKAIGVLTKRAKEAEAKAFSDITQNEGESDRVFNLRRRAEIAERVAAGSSAPAKEAAVATRPTVPTAAGAKLPPVKAAGDDPEPDPAKFEDLTKYFREQSLWAARETLRLAHAEHDKLTAAATQDAEKTRVQASWIARTTTAKTRYPDFEAVAYGPLRVPSMPHLTEIPSPSVIDTWIWDRPYGADLLYALKKNPAEFARIWNLPLGDQVEELTLLGQRLLSSRTQAVTTGAAAAVEVKPVPRPPTPVRTGPMRVSDDALPDPETVGLSGFAEAYGGSRQRH